MAKSLIRRGYGAFCETRDLDDYPELEDAPDARCASCRAAEVIAWIDDHIELIRG